MIFRFRHRSGRVPARGGGLSTLILAALLAAAPFPARALAQGDDPAAAAGPGEAPSYLIGKEDILRVSVYGEGNLSAERVPVRPDGKISVPLLGDVLAAGKSPERLAEELTERFRAHVRAPAVTVMVTEVNSFKVFLMGSIRSPGEYKLGRETTLLQALSLAGGFSEFANTKRILLIRDEDGAQRRLEINYEKIISGRNLEMNLKLKPGDTIVVP